MNYFSQFNVKTAFFFSSKLLKSGLCQEKGGGFRIDSIER